MEVRQIVEMLGGPAAAAAALNAEPHAPRGLTAAAVSMWSHNDKIPSAWGLVVLDLVRKRGLLLTTEEVLGRPLPPVALAS